MKYNLQIRLIQNSDTESVLNIYKYYVESTFISFEHETPTLEEYLQRIKTHIRNFPWLVCLQDNKIIGYAYGSRHRDRTAYQWSPESTIYLAPSFHGQGIGRILYETLFSLLRLQGYYNVFAGVALPNEKSVSFHKSSGFKEIGIFKNIGYKHGNWHDTHWFQMALTEPVFEPVNPKKTVEVIDDEAFKLIMVNANNQLENLNI